MRYNDIEIKIGNKTKPFVDKITDKNGELVLKIIKPHTTYYEYLVLENCKFCGESKYFSKDSIIRYGHVFCDHNCQHCYTRSIKDFKNSNILNNKNNNFYYLLGFLATDGTIMYPTEGQKYRGYNARLQLQIRDKHIIDEMYSNFGGRINFSEKYITWELSNKPFLEFLIKEVGFTTKKSKNLNVDKWFSGLSYEQQRHFIRGCWDGDGTIHVRATGYVCSSFVSSSESFYQTVLNFFKSFSPKTYKEKTINDADVYKISFHGKNMIKPLISIYGNLDDSDIVMKRKQKILTDLCEKYAQQ
jgi:hypothetical protein